MTYVLFTIAYYLDFYVGKFQSLVSFILFDS